MRRRAKADIRQHHRPTADVPHSLDNKICTASSVAANSELASRFRSIADMAGILLLALPGGD
jgi:hypothetical protein